MSSQTIDLMFGVTGQTLYFDAPEGRPSSVTSSTVYQSAIGDDGTSELATTGSAAVETSPNTTFDAASGVGQADPRVCNLTSTTGIEVGRPFLATTSQGERDWVEVVLIEGGAYVVARHPLANAYPASVDSTFESTRITHALSSTWIADKSKLSDDIDPNPRYRWRLVYKIDNTTYVHDVYFDLLRYQGRHDITPIDVDRRAPGWIDRVPTEYREDQGRAIVDEAYQVVKFDLYNLTLPDQSIRNREAINELVKLKAIELVDGGTAMQMYAARFSQLMEFGKVATSTDQSGAASPGDIRPIWRR